MASRKPCCSRNSERWKPSGSFCRMVCSITRGPAKPIRALRLGDVQVAQHGEAGGHAAGRRVGQDRDERNPGLVETGQRRRDLGQLHQADDAFHHARAAGGRHGDERLALVVGPIHGAGDGFADHGAHAAADEAVLHHAEDHAVGTEQALGIDDGVVQAGVGPGLAQAALVGLEVGQTPADRWT